MGIFENNTFKNEIHIGLFPCFFHRPLPSSPKLFRHPLPSSPKQCCSPDKTKLRNSRPSPSLCMTVISQQHCLGEEGWSGRRERGGVGFSIVTEYKHGFVLNPLILMKIKINVKICIFYVKI